MVFSAHAMQRAAYPLSSTAESAMRSLNGYAKCPAPRMGQSADTSISRRFLHVIVLLSQWMVDAERNVGTRQQVNVAPQIIGAVLLDDIRAER